MTLGRDSRALGKGEADMGAGEGTALSVCFAVSATDANGLPLWMPQSAADAGNAEYIHEFV